MSAILSDINAACGTAYRHNWPSLMAKRNYSLDRCPTNVRRYMMNVVLPYELKKLDVNSSKRVISAIVSRLT
jgi:hypothetical protein